MKILIISDAWQPQINGVVRTLTETIDFLKQAGHDIFVLGPDTKRRFVFSLPFYPEIKLEFFAYGRLFDTLSKIDPDYIHISTEGPLGWAARRACLKQGRPFTTSYHTRFPEYIAARLPRYVAKFAQNFSYALLRYFHAPSKAVMVATSSIEQDLRLRKFNRLVRWSRGVNASLFQPYSSSSALYNNLPRPILLYVGRLAVEKNVHAFLNLNTKGSKIVIGDGPDHDYLRKNHPTAHFLGSMEGEQLARHYAAADLFVFPSQTDTFGLVLLEACAAGLRVAACPAPGPVDIFEDTAACQDFCVLDNDLQRAVDKALSLPVSPDKARNFALRYSWENCTAQFYSHLQSPTKQSRKGPLFNKN